MNIRIGFDGSIAIAGSCWLALLPETLTLLAGMMVVTFFEPISDCGLFCTASMICGGVSRVLGLGASEPPADCVGLGLTRLIVAAADRWPLPLSTPRLTKPTLT